MRKVFHGATLIVDSPLVISDETISTSVKASMLLTLENKLRNGLRELLI